MNEIPKVRDLTPGEQIHEIQAEFAIEAIQFARNRSAIERQKAGNRINALLDAYLDIRADLIATQAT